MLGDSEEWPPGAARSRFGVSLWWPGAVRHGPCCLRERLHCARLVQVVRKIVAARREGLGARPDDVRHTRQFSVVADAVSSEASSHARLNTSFVAAKGQKGATTGSSEPGAWEVLPGWPGPKRPHELIPPGDLRTKALWPAPTRGFLVCAHALVACPVFGHHLGSSWKGGDTSRGGENRRLGQMA